MIKGVIALVETLNWIETSSGADIVLQTFGDEVSHALRIFLEYTASKKFKSNWFITMAVGATMI